MTKRDLPTPIYAAAGAGDLAYQRLRKLPDAAARTLRSAGRTASDLRRRMAEGHGLDLTRVRESAQRNAAVAAARASAAQRRAAAGYRRLVAHGEQVLAERNGRTATLEAEPPAELVGAQAVDTEAPEAGQAADTTPAEAGQAADGAAPRTGQAADPAAGGETAER